MRLSPNQKKYLDDYIKKSGDSIEDFKHPHESKTIDFDGGWIEYSVDDSNDIWIDTMYSENKHRKTEELFKVFIKMLKDKDYRNIFFTTKLMQLNWNKICNASKVGHIYKIHVNDKRWEQK